MAISSKKRRYTHNLRYSKNTKKKNSVRLRGVLISLGLIITSTLASFLSFSVFSDFKTMGEEYSPYAVGLSSDYYENEIEKQKDIFAWREPQESVFEAVQIPSDQKVAEDFEVVAEVSEPSVIQTASIGSINNFDNTEGELVQVEEIDVINSVWVPGAMKGSIAIIDSLDSVVDSIESSENTGEYVVQPGDSLWSIAEAQLGDGALWSTIASQNSILSADNGWVISPGQVLNI